MKLKHAVHLFQENFTTATFGFANRNDLMRYTYKVLLSDNIQVGNYAVVITDAGPKLVLCYSVDKEPKIDVDADFDYKWVVQVVNFEKWNELNASELEFQNSMQDMEKAKLREEIKTHIVATVGGDSKMLSIFEGAVKSLNEKLVEGDDKSE